MQKRTEEWLKQADYDLDTADYMHAGGRYHYAVFMSHLAVEKALKGLYFEMRRQFPPEIPQPAVPAERILISSHRRLMANSLSG